MPKSREQPLWVSTRLSRIENASAPNVLAFSCEAANAMIQCSQNRARLRLLQRRVRRQSHAAFRQAVGSQTGSSGANG